MSPSELGALRWPRVVLGVCGRDRRVQGRRGLPAARRRRRLRRPVLTEDAHPLHRRAHVLGARVRARAHLAVRRARARSRTPGSGSRADLIVVAPGHRQAARQVRGRHLRRPADRHAARHPGARARLPGDAHRDVGAPGGAGEPRARCAAGASTCVDPESGRLAGGDVGAGRLADPGADRRRGRWTLLAGGRDLAGVRVLVTAGGTREAIDPVRFVGNRSSGKMGYALAEVAASRGAAVDARDHRRRGRCRRRVDGRPRSRSAEDMHREVLARFPDVDVVVMAAAVADFRPKATAGREAEEGRRAARDRARADAGHPRRARRGQGRARCWSASRPRPSGCRSTRPRSWPPSRSTSSWRTTSAPPDAGFEVDTNRAMLLDSSGAVEETPLLSKTALAGVILDRVASGWAEGRRTARALEHHDKGEHVSSYPFTSESVTEGHPDKMCDQISRRGPRRDLRGGPEQPGGVRDAGHHRACVVVAGEISTQAYIDIPRVVRDTVNAIGYDRRVVRLRRPHLRCHHLDRRAVAGHRDGRRQGGRAAGRDRRPLRRGGRGRPGDDVRLRLRRDRGPDADADLARAPARATGSSEVRKAGHARRTCAPTARPRSRSSTWTASRSGSPPCSSRPSTARASTSTR